MLPEDSETPLSHLYFIIRPGSRAHLRATGPKTCVAAHQGRKHYPGNFDQCRFDDVEAANAMEGLPVPCDLRQGACTGNRGTSEKNEKVTLRHPGLLPVPWPNRYGGWKYGTLCVDKLQHRTTDIAVPLTFSSIAYFRTEESIVLRTAWQCTKCRSPVPTSFTYGRKWAEVQEVVKCYVSHAHLARAGAVLHQQLRRGGLGSLMLVSLAAIDISVRRLTFFQFSRQCNVSGAARYR